MLINIEIPENCFLVSDGFINQYNNFGPWFLLGSNTSKMRLNIDFNRKKRFDSSMCLMLANFNPWNSSLLDYTLPSYIRHTLKIITKETLFYKSQSFSVTTLNVPSNKYLWQKNLPEKNITVIGWKHLTNMTFNSQFSFRQFGTLQTWWRGKT